MYTTICIYAYIDIYIYMYMYMYIYRHVDATNMAEFRNLSGRGSAIPTWLRLSVLQWRLGLLAASRSHMSEGQNSIYRAY